MWMGFIGFGSTPPAPPSSDDEPPREDGADDTGIRIGPAIAARRSRYGRKISAVGRHAWAISLGIHAIVLLGAFLAMRYYFRPLPAPKPEAAVQDQSGTGSILQGAQVSDVIHGSSGIAFVADDGAMDREALDFRNLPASVRREPQLSQTLIGLTDSRSVEGLHDRTNLPLANFPAPLHGHGPAATQRSLPISR
jgi:hypothetical protein